MSQRETVLQLKVVMKSIWSQYEVTVNLQDMYCEWEINSYKRLRLRGCFCMCPCLVAQWTIAHQAPLSLGLSRQEYWSGLPFPPPGDLPNPGFKPASPVSPALQVVCLLTRNKNSRTSLEVQWLRPQASIAMAMDWTPCWGTKIWHAAQSGQKRKKKKKQKAKTEKNSLVAQDIQHQVDEGLLEECWFSC